MDVLPSVSCAEVLSELLERQNFTDVTFLVEGRELPAHRVLLALFSEHFRAMLASGMRESFENRVRAGSDGFPACLSCPSRRREKVSLCATASRAFSTFIYFFCALHPCLQCSVPVLQIL